MGGGGSYWTKSITIWQFTRALWFTTSFLFSTAPLATPPPQRCTNSCWEKRSQWHQSLIDSPFVTDESASEQNISVIRCFLVPSIHTVTPASETRNLCIYKRGVSRFPLRDHKLKHCQRSQNQPRSCFFRVLTSGHCSLCLHETCKWGGC